MKAPEEHAHVTGKARKMRRLVLPFETQKTETTETLDSNSFITTLSPLEALGIMLIKPSALWYWIMLFQTWLIHANFWKQFRFLSLHLLLLLSLLCHLSIFNVCCWKIVQSNYSNACGEWKVAKHGSTKRFEMKRKQKPAPWKTWSYRFKKKLANKNRAIEKRLYKSKLNKLKPVNGELLRTKCWN